jgi:NADH:ubiquinone oxidoreductase subunit K
MIDLILLTVIALVSIALAGIISDRHFVVIMLAIELIFIGSIVLLAYFFANVQGANVSAVPMMIAIWSVAAAEVITLITFYVFMKARGFEFDITKLSRFRW